MIAWPARVMPWLPLRRCGLHARALGRHFGSSPLRTSLRKRPGMEALTSADRARSDATAAFLAAVHTVRPANLIKKAVRLDGNVLSVKGLHPAVLLLCTACR